MGGKKVHADDTPVPVLAPGRGKTRTGRLWTYVRDDRAAASEQPAAVWFGYSPDRKGEHPQRHLKGFQGIVQADGYAGFNALYDSRSEEHTSELQSLMRISYAVFCLKKKKRTMTAY